MAFRFTHMIWKSQLVPHIYNSAHNNTTISKNKLLKLCMVGYIIWWPHIHQYCFHMNGSTKMSKSYRMLHFILDTNRHSLCYPKSVYSLFNPPSIHIATIQVSLVPVSRGNDWMLPNPSNILEQFSENRGAAFFQIFISICLHHSCKQKPPSHVARITQPCNVVLCNC